MPTVWLVGVPTDLRESIAGALDGSGRACTAPEGELPALVKARGPQVVAFGPDLPVDTALAQAQALCDEDSPSAVVLIAEAVDAPLMRAALRAGMEDVLSADESPAELASSLMRAASIAAHRQTLASGNGELGTPNHARCIVVFGMKGGVGKSVIATNLAVSLAADGKSRVILVDLDLQCGDAAIMLQLEPKRTILDAVQAFDRLDEGLLRALLSEHPSGVSVLLAPVHPEDADAVTSTRLAAILDILSGMADYVVVDTPSELNENVLTTLDKADVVLTVATMEVPAVKNTRVALQKLHQLGFDNGRVKLVLNRADSKVFLDVKDVEKAVQRSVSVSIPSDRLVPRAVNKGVPVVLDAPRSQVARAFASMAAEVMTPEGGGNDVAQ